MQGDGQGDVAPTWALDRLRMAWELARYLPDGVHGPTPAPLAAVSDEVRSTQPEMIAEFLNQLGLREYGNPPTDLELVVQWERSRPEMPRRTPAEVMELLRPRR